MLSRSGVSALYICAWRVAPGALASSDWPEGRMLSAVRGGVLGQRGCG